MLRKLMASDVCVIVPYHPELIGDHTRSVDDGFTWVGFQDERGPFVPVFTSHVCAEYETRNKIRRLNEEKTLIAELPAEVLIAFLNDGKTIVRVIAAGGGIITLTPEAVANLANGKYTNPEIPKQDANASMVHIKVMDESKIPSKVLNAIRVFCAQRRVPLGVYAFHQMDEQTGEFPENDMRVMLWLRTPDGNFYNDFCIMVERMMPDRLEFFCTAVTSEDEQVVTFLQGKRPIWPIMKKEK